MCRTALTSARFADRTYYHRTKQTTNSVRVVCAEFKQNIVIVIGNAWKVIVIPSTKQVTDWGEKHQRGIDYKQFEHALHLLSRHQRLPFREYISGVKPFLALPSLPGPRASRSRRAARCQSLCIASNERVSELHHPPRATRSSSIQHNSRHSRVPDNRESQRVCIHDCRFEDHVTGPSTATSLKFRASPKTNRNQKNIMSEHILELLFEG